MTTLSYLVGGTTNAVTDPRGNASGDSPSQHTAETVLYAFGRTAQTVLPSPDGGTTASPTATYAYDADGDVTLSTDANGDQTAVAYDGMDRPVTVTPPRQATGTPSAASATTLAYDSAGNVTSETDHGLVSAGLNGTTSLTYNAWDQVLTSTAPAPAGGTAPVTADAYDSAGRQVGLTDPDGNATRYQFNQLGEVTAELDPSQQADGQNPPTTSYGYDADGNVTSTVDPDGRLTVDGYDHDDRRTGQWQYAGNTLASTLLDHVTTAYDAAGRVTSVADNAGTTAFGYDNDNRLTTEAETFAGLGTPVALNLGYDADGDATSLGTTVGGTRTGSTTTGGTADLLNTYGFDADGRETAVTQQGQAGGNGVAAKAATFGFDPDGRTTNVSVFANATGAAGGRVASTTYGYNHQGQLTGLTHVLGTAASPTATLASTFGFDAAGRLTSMTTPDGSATLTVDADGRLTKVTPGNGSGLPAEAYAYDKAGNRTSASVGTSPSAAVTTPNSNQVSSDGTYTYGYDAAGNETSRTRIDGTGSDAYVYDDRDRLVSDTVTATGSPTATVGYTYWAATNQRASRTLTVNGTSTTEYYVYGPDGNLLEVLDGSGSVKERELTGPGLDEVLATETVTTPGQAGARHWLMTNQVGSVTDVVSDDGTAADHVVYTSYGVVYAQTNPMAAVRFGFAGMQMDAATGLDYDNARWYDPSQGRFVTRDPLGFGGGDTDEYRYVGGDPAQWVDPTGLQVVPDYIIYQHQVETDQWNNWDKLRLANPNADIPIPVDPWEPWKPCPDPRPTTAKESPAKVFRDMLNAYNKKLQALNLAYFDAVNATLYRECKIEAVRNGTDAADVRRMWQDILRYKNAHQAELLRDSWLVETTTPPTSQIGPKTTTDAEDAAELSYQIGQRNPLISEGQRNFDRALHNGGGLDIFIAGGATLAPLVALAGGGSSGNSETPKFAGREVPEDPSPRPYPTPLGQLNELYSWEQRSINDPIPTMRYQYPPGKGGMYECPIPDARADRMPHSVIRMKVSGTTGLPYVQGLTFGEDGLPLWRMDFSDHGTPWHHDNPHYHLYYPGLENAGGNWGPPIGGVPIFR